MLKTVKPESSIEADTGSESLPEWRETIDHLREMNPSLLNRIGRKMMNYLFKRNTKQFEQLMQLSNISENGYSRQGSYSDNQPTPRMNSSLLEQIVDEIFKIAEQELDDEEINRMINIWMRSEQTRFLTMTAEKRDVALEEITESVHRFMMLPDAQKILTREEKTGVHVALIRRFFSDDLEYINTTKNHVNVNDFAHILEHIVGPTKGNGKLGGKAAGLFRAEKILHAAKRDNIVLRNLSVPKTWYITSDGIMNFLHYNALEEMPTIKYRDPIEIRQEYPYIEQIFKNSSLPPEFLEGLNRILMSCGTKPLVVRSSSLLEDMQGSAFAGKYKSLFVANQGTKQERLEALVDAVLEVYASVFGPDPIEYRRERGLLDFNEEMALMIQEVVGKRVGKYFFPAFAGVAFSYNEYRMSPRMQRTDGIMRLVTGLGTRAVDRLGDDYPTLVCPGQPGLRVNTVPEDILKYSQRNVDVINLESRRLESVNVEKLVQELEYDYPLLSQIVSMYREGNFYDPVSLMFNLTEGIPIVTFANLIDRSPFIPQMKAILNILQNTLGFPVDIEFASGGDVHTLYILQCRPQSEASKMIRVSIPKNIPADDQLFSANRYVTAGLVQDIEYIVYVDPFEYDAITTFDDLLQVGKIVGELNAKLPSRKFILMGPGRWGSRGDIKLGVRVGYSDINNTAMLIEIARKKKGYVPDLSFGTHFFQDLVEARILYLPLYPDEPGVIFNEVFFKQSPNVLTKFVPDSKKFEKEISVIHISKMFPHSTVSILMDGDADTALAFIKRNGTK